MIDTLMKKMPEFKCPELWQSENLENTPYLVLTVHRPSNVDNVEKLSSLLNKISEIAHDFKVILPVHPRLREKIKHQEMFVKKFNFYRTLILFEI